ncbi:glycosyltransferase family 1 protein [Natronospora cellulosivora (SeqCode)]
MENRNSGPMRILCIVGGMNAGGAETFLMKVYRSLDRSKYQMDFYVSSKGECYYDKEIKSMGGRIFRSVPKTRNLFKSFKALHEVVKREEYLFVLRVSQHSLSSLDLIAAKLGGAKVLVFRSSNSGTGGGNVDRILHTLFKWLTITVPTIKIAPSTEAANFMFGRKSIDKGNAIIVKNGLEIDNYKYNQEIRKRLRKEFNIEDKFVIGHVGRFNEQKNHLFLLDIFEEILKRDNDSILLLVGKGELEEDIKNKIDKLGLKENVIFTGVRSDVPEIMMAMDVLIFPSLYEGMPNTLIEAQATGLPCIASNSITKEANITGLMSFLSLKDNVKCWADIALEYKSGFKREHRKEAFIENGYDITSVSQNLVDIIFKL